MMNTDKIYRRARATLLTPTAEWPVIAAEPETVRNLYVSYVLVMAAIPAVVLNVVAINLTGSQTATRHGIRYSR